MSAPGRQAVDSMAGRAQALRDHLRRNPDDASGILIQFIRLIQDGYPEFSGFVKHGTALSGVEARRLDDLADRERRLQDLESHIAERERYVTDLEGRLSERERDIEARGKQLDERTRVLEQNEEYVEACSEQTRGRERHLAEVITSISNGLAEAEFQSSQAERDTEVADKAVSEARARLQAVRNAMRNVVSVLGYAGSGLGND